MVHTDHTPNTTQALMRSFKIPNYAWRLSGSSWVTEARTFYLLSEQGEFILFQMAYTNPGWPVPESCQVTARYFDARQAGGKPDSNGWIGVPQFRSRRRSILGHGRHHSDPSSRGGQGHVGECVNQPASKMKTSSNKTGMILSGSQICIVGPSTNGAHEVDGGGGSGRTASVLGGAVRADSIHGEYRGTLLNLDFLFEPLCDGCTFGDGRISFGVEGEDGDIDMRFLPAGRVRGTVSIDGISRTFSGMGMGVHQFQGIRPNLVASRWNFFYFTSDEDAIGERLSLFMIQLGTSPTYGSETVNYGALYGDGRLLALCRGGKCTPFAPALDTVSGYYIPREFRLHWVGQTVDGDRFEATCHSQPQILCERMNLLDQLPFVLRKIVETFVTRPYIYQWFDRVTVNVSIKSNSDSISGWLYNELSLLGDD